MEPTEADSCVFRSPGTIKECLILTLHVDDGLVVSAYKKKVKKFINLLEQVLEITVSIPSMYLGIHLSRLEDGSFFADQKMYTEQLLAKFRMTEANEVSATRYCVCGESRGSILRKSPKDLLGSHQEDT